MRLDRVGHVFFSRSQRREIERLSRREPERVGRHATHWSFRSLAEATMEQGYADAIAYTTIRKILYAADLRLPLFRFWKTTIWDDEASGGLSKFSGITNESRACGSAAKSSWRLTKNPICKFWNGYIRSNRCDRVRSNEWSSTMSDMGRCICWQD
jgi:hypothetical protein